MSDRYELETERQLAQAQAEIERLRYELLIIGDIAVVNWDDLVVGKVDAVVTQVPKTYAELRRAEIAQVAALRSQLAEARAVIQGMAYDSAEARHWLATNREGK